MTPQDAAKPRGRGRPSTDPRGPAQVVGIKLGPTHRELLARLVKRRKSNRSAVVREWLEKTAAQG